jgi:soluble lytic murein transglycosylase-like protein
MNKADKTLLVLLVGGGLLVIGSTVASRHNGRIPSPNPNVTQWDNYIHFYSSGNSPKALIAAIIEVESMGRANAIGAAGEYGLMQLKCATAQQVGFVGECKVLDDPKLNIFYGVKYLQWQWRRYKGDLREVISAYNAGTATSSNATYVNKTMSAYQRYLNYYK